MKICSIDLFAKGSFAEHEEYEIILQELSSAIISIVWYSNDKFIINPVKLKNGVNPIKTAFIGTLENFGWEVEKSLSIGIGAKPGPIDAIKRTSQGIFAVEWETGNISSSHRALNKIALGIQQELIVGGFLVLPIKKFSKYLTDRVGNYEEMAPYFELYKSLNFAHGVIGVIAVDCDGISSEAPFIPKGKDGNAKKVKKKLKKKN
jgi:hypothetical protein